MRVLIVNTDYPGFLQWLYRGHAGLERRSYAEQLQVRYDSLFGVADFYSSNLRKLGVDAQDIFVNNEHLQGAWVREHQAGNSELGVLTRLKRSLAQYVRGAAACSPVRYLKPVLRPLLGTRSGGQSSSWQERVLAAQIQHYRPDVLLNQDLCWTDGRFWSEMKQHIGLLVGQIASSVPEGQVFKAYDAVLSSLPNIVEWFKRRGVRTIGLRKASPDRAFPFKIWLREALRSMVREWVLNRPKRAALEDGFFGECRRVVPIGRERTGQRSVPCRSCRTNLLQSTDVGTLMQGAGDASR